MKVFGNIIWFIFGGFAVALVAFLLGLVFCITIVGVPVGLQMFKIAKLQLAPFGKNVSLDPAKHPIANAIWLVFFGWELAIINAVACLVLCLTIVLIPLGIQGFKLSKLLLFPFGAEVN